MVRGRKPMPSAVHELRGDYDKDPQRRRKNEPKPPTGSPKCPEFLNELAKQEFEFITRIMAKMHILSLADSSALAMYCQTFGQWREAVDMCAQYGSWNVGKDGKGNTTTTRNEWDRIRERSADSCRRWLIEFGLTPSARTRLQVSEEVKDDFDAFLSRYSTN
jgi:P27 family predicted phage terminase small subunit